MLTSGVIWRISSKTARRIVAIFGKLVLGGLMNSIGYVRSCQTDRFGNFGRFSNFYICLHGDVTSPLRGVMTSWHHRSFADIITSVVDRLSPLRGIMQLLENSICNVKPSSAHADYLRRWIWHKKNVTRNIVFKGKIYFYLYITAPIQSRARPISC